MKQRSGSSSLSALKLKSFASLVKWWARIIHITWKVTCLYGIFTGCVWMHAQIPENHWQCECSKSDDPGTNAGTHYPCIFRNLCVKGALEKSTNGNSLKQPNSVEKTWTWQSRAAEIRFYWSQVENKERWRKRPCLSICSSTDPELIDKYLIL